MSNFEHCVALGYEESNDLLKCVAKGIEEKVDEGISQSVDSFFLIWATSLVFFMQAGFAMLCAGAVRLKNVQNTMLKNLLDACGASLGFYSVGYAFAYGGSLNGESTTFIGHTNFFLIGVDDDRAVWLFQFAFAATAATIVAGTLAERCQMAAYLCYSVTLTGFVYPVIVHAIWSNNGFLSPTNENNRFLGSGVIDFAGSGVVHTTGGLTALIATFILGPRQGRFYDERGRKLEEPRVMKGHSMALQMLGTFILWFGWYGFNAGSVVTISSQGLDSVAALAAVNTTLAAAAGTVSSLFVKLYRTERLTGEATFDITAAMNGCLGGLVSITAGCSVVEPWAAIVIGLLGGCIYLYCSWLLIRFRLDDAVDAIPVHLANGAWGLIAVGLFATPSKLEAAYGLTEAVGFFYSFGHTGANLTLLGCQATGLIFIASWVFFLETPFFLFLNYLGWFRSDSLEEIVGLDVSYHGANSNAVEEVRSEYIEAYNRRRISQMQRRNSFGRGGGSVTSDSPDDEYDDEKYDQV